MPRWVVTTFGTSSNAWGKPTLYHRFQPTNYSIASMIRKWSLSLVHTLLVVVTLTGEWLFLPKKNWHDVDWFVQLRLRGTLDFLAHIFHQRVLQALTQ